MYPYLMPPEPLTIYLDESGYTGNNLLDEAQPLFVMSAVAIAPADAAELVGSVSREFGLTAKELKGSRLCGFKRGQLAVLKILAELQGKFRYVAMNKRYAAACIAFEYLVEPVISECNWFFYQQRFHHFIADAIFNQTRSESKEILSGLSTAIRERNPDKVFDALIAVPMPGETATILSLLKELVASNRDAIMDEFRRLQDFNEGRWLMDLSFTGLFSLLCNWAEEGRPLDVHCDQSKPLAEFAPHLSARIGGKSEEFKMPFGDKRRMFSLASEILLEDSAAVPGLQLADVVASASTVVLNNPRSDFGRRAGVLLVDYIDPSSMAPNSRPFTEEQAGRLGDLLVLIAKARAMGKSPCEKMKEILEKAELLRKSRGL